MYTIRHGYIMQYTYVDSNSQNIHTLEYNQQLW